MSLELTTFKKHFQENTGIKVISTIEEKHFPHWKRLVFAELDADHLKTISAYIIKHFSSLGTYSHRLPKLHSYNGNLCLTVDVNEIKEFLL